MNLQKIRITSITEPEFHHFWHIYNQSFPEIERKNLKGLEIALSKEQFHNMLVTLDGKPAAFLSYWLYPQFCYLEYIAISPELKGNGAGTMILKELIDGTSQPIILEIEHITDNTTQRRQNFYERLGFIANPEHNHEQPPYQQGFKPLPMLLMTYPQRISKEAYAHFNNLLINEMAEI